MRVYTAIYNDCKLLPHFLRHYKSIGAEHFYISIHPSLESEALSCLSEYSATLRVSLDVADSLLAGTTAVWEMRSSFQEENEWIVIADLDEFLELSSPIADILTRAESYRANVVRGVMHDRFTESGKEGVINTKSDLASVFPIKARFIRDVMVGCDMKGILVKGLLKPAPHSSHHRYLGERVHTEVLDISHYKWIKGAIERLRKSLGLVNQAELNWAVEYQRILEHYEAHDRFDWRSFGGCPAVSFNPESTQRCLICGGVIDHLEARYSRKEYGYDLCRRHQGVIGNG